MIVIGSNTSDNGKTRFTEDVSHFMELRQNRQIAKRSAKNWATVWGGGGGSRGTLSPNPRLSLSNWFLAALDALVKITTATVSLVNV